MKIRVGTTVAMCLIVLWLAGGKIRAQVDYRAGTSTLSSGNSLSITFPVPMPDADYSVSLQPSGTPGGFSAVNACTYFDVSNKTAAGFLVSLKKCHTPGNPVNATHLTLDWIAMAYPCVEGPGVTFVGSLAAYTSAVASLTDTTVDFSLDCSGASTHALYAEVPGNFYDQCALLTFASFGVSNQYYPAGSCTPFRGQALAYVAGIGADHGGPSIGSSAGGLNYSGYDGIEADFSRTMTAVGLAVTALPQGGTLEVIGPSGTVTHTYPLPASASPAFYGVTGACIKGVRVAPGSLCSLILNTSSWGITMVHFAH